jgi:hypothetical protein
VEYFSAQDCFFMRLLLKKMIFFVNQTGFSVLISFFAFLAENDGLPFQKIDHCRVNGMRVRMQSGHIHHFAFSLSVEPKALTD